MGGAGESVGHDSGRKIVKFFKTNPDKKADQYSDKEMEHIRRIAVYW